MNAGRRRAALVTIGALLCTTFVGLSGRADAGPTHQVPTVKPIRPVKVALPTDAEAKSSLRKSPTVEWPTQAAIRSTSGTVRILDRAAARRAGVKGVLFQVSPPAGRVGEAPQPGKVTGGKTGMVATRRTRVSIDYSGFRNAYGGDWASRLGVARLSGKRTVPVKSSNNLAKHTLTADLPSPQGTYVVQAEAVGPMGSYLPTSLAPSATWQVGLQSGDFEWSHPFRLPPAPGGTPEVSLSYSSGGIDGHAAATNNQPEWAGEGFNLQAGGFIERSFKPCKEDGQSSSGDLCWNSFNSKPAQNAIVSLPGLTGELVRDDTNPKLWKAERDSGFRVELLTGTTNGDNDGEYWKLTGPDGTQYFFGRNRSTGWATGNAEANSAWTVPVFGNNTNEPCYTGTFSTSSCVQAYRWQLDSVVTPHGDVTSYYYTTETNYYLRNGATNSPYVRGGQLQRIDYGQREGQVNSTSPAARVLFTPADRCLDGSQCVQSAPEDWPDTPWDQACTSSSCAKTIPTFWTSKRLDKITTQVSNGAGYRDVDIWKFGHEYPLPGDVGNPVLWLNSIAHTGHVGTAVSTPAIRFDGGQYANRVATQDSTLALRKRRVTAIYNETGGAVKVNYAPVECDTNALPTPDSNKKRCFPEYQVNSDGSTGALEFYHKYVVSQITEEDLVGPTEDKVTAYEYIGGAWAHDDLELVPDARKSWGQWRGFLRIKVRVGTLKTDEPRSLTEHLLLQGMDGDLNSDKTRKQVTVTDSLGDPLADLPVRRGFSRETIVYSHDGGSVLSVTRNDPWESTSATATRARSSGTLAAYLTGLARVRSRTVLDGGQVRETDQKISYDSYGFHQQTDDLGDVSTAADDVCSKVSYARNLTTWILSTISAVDKYGKACGAESTADLLTSTRKFYDGSTALDAAPSKGDVTQVDELVNAGSYQTVSRAVYDIHGRPADQFDGNGNKTTTAYTPATGGPVTKVKTTNALGHVSSSDLEPAWGSPTVQTDANGRLTQLRYDGLGRPIKVWLPGRATGSTANYDIAYNIRADALSTVTAKRLIDGSRYATTIRRYDGLGRDLQTEVGSPRNSTTRVLVDTAYDTHGRVRSKTSPYTSSTNIPSRTEIRYDGTDRVVADILTAQGVEKWRTTTSYGGNWTKVDPPDGGTATQTVTDARGRTVELRQFRGEAPNGDYDSTRYTYTSTGRLATTTDPAGNTWKYTYDLRGREIRSEHPDKGVTTTGYNANGNVTSRTDARGKTLTIGYDALNRKSSLSEGQTKRAEWTYDTLPSGKGLLTSSTRFDGDPYIVAVTGYDTRGRASGRKVALPASEGFGTADLSFGIAYTEDDQPARLTFPAIGDLPSESALYKYNSLGLPESLGGLARYVAATYTDYGEIDNLVFGDATKSLSQSLTYDQATRRISTIQVGPASAPVASLSYRYDAAGNVTRIADRPGTTDSDVQCMQNDYLQRLVEAWTPATDNCGVAPSVSALGGVAPYWSSYSYDLIGNRKSQIDHAAAGNITTTSTFPAAGASQPHTVRSTATTGPSGNSSGTYTYDAAGNQTGNTATGQTMTWDSEGHLSKATKGSDITSYVYDADGNRLLRKDSSGTTLTLGDTELTVSGGTIKGARYYRFGDRQVAVRKGGSVSWLTSDQNGTAIAAVASTTLSADIRRLTPFGAPRGLASTGWPGDHGFLGGPTDSTGLTHLGAREYDPIAGRFISADPVVDHSEPQQVNGFAYANNSPFTFIDPDGLKAKKPPKATYSGVITFGSGSIKPPKGISGPLWDYMVGNVSKVFSQAINGNKPKKNKDPWANWVDDDPDPYHADTHQCQNYHRQCGGLNPGYLDKGDTDAWLWMSGAGPYGGPYDLGYGYTIWDFGGYGGDELDFRSGGSYNDQQDSGPDYDYEPVYVDPNGGGSSPLPDPNNDTAPPFLTGSSIQSGAPTGQSSMAPSSFAATSPASPERPVQASAAPSWQRLWTSQPAGNSWLHNRLGG